MTRENMSELREELDKNGVAWSSDYDDNGDTTAWKSPRGQLFNCGHEGFNHDLYLYVSPITAKQAIAATLGDEWDGKPFVEYVEHVAKEIHDEAFVLLEGCDEPDSSAIYNICGACVDVMRIAGRWRRGESQDEFTTFERATLTADQVREFLERHSMFDDATWLHGTAELVFDEDELQVMADELNATLGGGECELVETDSYSNANEVIHVLECSECGRTCEHVNGSYPRCPHCGKVAR